MSLQTWKDEFMPVPVDKVPKDEISILQRDLLKWKGLRSEELKRHGLVRESYRIGDSTGFLTIDSTNCALCHNFLVYHNVLLNDTVHCVECPLYKTRNAKCDDYKNAKDQNSPYHHFVRFGNPEPMIELIQKSSDKILDTLPKCERCKNKIFEPVRIGDKQFCLTCTCPDCGCELPEHLDLCTRCMDEFLENDY